MTCPFGTMDWYCCLAAGHAGPHESHELPPDTSTNPPPVPSLDVEAPIPAGYARVIDWPCKKCQSPNVVSCLDDSDPAYDDHHFICLDCQHAWWEESSDY